MPKTEKAVAGEGTAPLVDLSAIWREDADETETLQAYQSLVNSGQAWRMEGAVGRTAMDLIRSGKIMLGHEGHRDYWGNYVPGRDEVSAHTKGHPTFVEDMSGENHRATMEVI